MALSGRTSRRDILLSLSFPSTEDCPPHATKRGLDLAPAHGHDPHHHDPIPSCHKKCQVGTSPTQQRPDYRDRHHYPLIAQEGKEEEEQDALPRPAPEPLPHAGSPARGWRATGSLRVPLNAVMSLGGGVPSPLLRLSTLLPLSPLPTQLLSHHPLRSAPLLTSRVSFPALPSRVFCPALPLRVSPPALGRKSSPPRRRAIALLGEEGVLHPLFRVGVLW